MTNMSGMNREGEHPVNHPFPSVESALDDIKTGVFLLLRGPVHREPAYWMGGVRHRDGASSVRALVRNCKNLRCDVKGAGQEK